MKTFRVKSRLEKKGRTRRLSLEMGREWMSMSFSMKLLAIGLLYWQILKECSIF